MKLETFFEKFDQFADAPDAVAKMRELVLQLAVTGRLVTQDKRDEPASVLLESTEAERAKLTAAKKIKSRPTSPVESDEHPFDLPSSWAWARLSDVGYELGQKVPDKRFTYIDVGGIDSDKGRISDRVEKLEPDDAPSRARKLVARGTVIYSTVRPYLLNIAIVDQDFDPEPIASTAFGILHPFVGINNRYLFYWLRSAPFTAYVQAGMKGMAYPAINDEKFYSGFIALPPLAEQKRIVAKVDELMALCDRLEAQQQERETRHAALARASLARFADAPTPANLHFLFHPSYAIPPADLRKSILTLAVQGKLVPQDPNDEPALTLLDQIAFHKAALTKEGKLRGSTTVKAMADDEAEFEIPSNWCWVRFGEIMVNRDGERIPVSKEERETKAKTYDYYGASGVIDKIDGYLFDKPLLLIGEDGANLINRSTPIAFIARGKYWVNNHAHVLDGISEDFLRFIELHINAINLEKYVTGSAQPKMNQAKMNSIPIALPPLAEQRRIVAKVEQLMALVDALEQQLAASRATAANLLTALVAELTTA
ncbi:MAG: restriction endonuclease subunit S [Verrucomicrobia bacterium]|nr:restriction endonuclease subunit S [Verrucomicrobiota bacterium]